MYGMIPLNISVNFRSQEVAGYVSKYSTKVLWDR